MTGEVRSKLTRTNSAAENVKHAHINHGGTQAHTYGPTQSHTHMNTGRELRKCGCKGCRHANIIKSIKMDVV